jgi:hypothetical protein
MAKLFSTSFPIFIPGIPSTAPKYINVVDNGKYWNARKALTFSLKKYFYYLNIAKYNCQASTSGFYRSNKFDVGDYCKNQYTVTTSSGFKVNLITAPTYYASNGEYKPVTIFIKMCRSNVDSTWTANITQKYRRTNSLDSGGGAANVSDVKEKKRNCYKDYEWNGEKWVKISENPDTNFFDYTVTFPSTLTFTASQSYSETHLDPDTLEVLSGFDFRGTYNHLVFGGTIPKEYCPKIGKSGTLVFAGKPVSSDVDGLGTACGGSSGFIAMNITWIPSEKLELI